MFSFYSVSQERAGADFSSETTQPETNAMAFFKSCKIICNANMLNTKHWNVVNIK